VLFGRRELLDITERLERFRVAAEQMAGNSSKDRGEVIGGKTLARLYLDERQQI